MLQGRTSQYGVVGEENGRENSAGRGSFRQDATATPAPGPLGNARQIRQCLDRIPRRPCEHRLAPLSLVFVLTRCLRKDRRFTIDTPVPIWDHGPCKPLGTATVFLGILPVPLLPTVCL